MSDTVTAWDAAHRARVVAGIHTLAQLVEDRTDLPVPDSVSAQYSIPGDLDHRGRQLVIAAATSLDVDPEFTDNSATAWRSIAHSDLSEPYFRVTYTVYGSVDEKPAEAAS